jgi:thiol-disulfide isomerase/thioredoxin
MRVLLAVLVSALLLSACAEEPDVGVPVPTPSPSPLGPLGIDVASEDLIELKAQSGMLDCPPSPDPDPEEPEVSPATPLPPVTLPCLGGGRDVRFDQLDGPLVLNFWASYCEPCRKELPVLQQVHELGADQLTVLGVDYDDEKPYAALTLAALSGVTYASVADLNAVTATELQVIGLPQTVFVDGTGAVVATHRGEITSYDQAADLVLEHLGLRLPEPEPETEPTEDVER